MNEIERQIKLRPDVAHICIRVDMKVHLSGNYRGFGSDTDIYLTQPVPNGGAQIERASARVSETMQDFLPALVYSAETEYAKQRPDVPSDSVMFNFSYHVEAEVTYDGRNRLEIDRTEAVATRSSQYTISWQNNEKPDLQKAAARIARSEPAIVAELIVEAMNKMFLTLEKQAEA